VLSPKATAACAFEEEADVEVVGDANAAMRECIRAADVDE
jgi:hypothetical protein